MSVRPADWTDLHWAVWTQDLDSVKAICTRQIDIDAVDERKWTALHLANTSKSSSLWKTRQLEGRELDHHNGTTIILSNRPGAETRYPQLTYNYSLYTQDHSELAETTLSFMILVELLQSGARFDITDGAGLSPLHCAMASGWPEHVDVLLSYGAVPSRDPNFSNLDPNIWATGPTVNHQRAFEYVRKKIGPDAWKRLQYRFPTSLPDFSWPSPDFQNWYFTQMAPNASRFCLPGSTHAIDLLKIDGSNICTLCKNVSLQSLRSTSGYLHALSLHALKRQGQTCSLCRFFLSFMENRIPFMLESDISQVILRLKPEATSRGKTTVFRLQLSSGCYCHVLQHQTVQARSKDFTQCLGNCRGMLMEDIVLDFFTSDHEASNSESLFCGKTPFETSDSDNAMATARSWYKQCSSGHESCQKRAELHKDYLPTRVIDVRKFEVEGTVQLVLGANHSGSYTALSHRWVLGKPDWVTTTKNAEARSDKDFKPSILPKCLQNAIQCTSQLGIPFIWIDSVCILQDSKEDWREESAKMIDVFGNASLTLFAEASENDDFEFLKPRVVNSNFQQRKGVSLSLDNGNGTAVKVQALQRYSRYKPGIPAKATELFASDVIHSHLSNRGWIFQEQVISPRRLHFGHHQMYWVCEELFEAEDGTDLKQSAPAWLQWIFNKDHPSRVESYLDGRVQKARISLANHLIWSSLVENYTRRSLTMSTDKLLAISALAKSFGQQLRSDSILNVEVGYMVGCWESSFRLDLLWVARPTCSPTQDAIDKSKVMFGDSSKIPTWSWLAADGAVEYPHTGADKTTRTAETTIMHVYFQIVSLPRLKYDPVDADRFTTMPRDCTPIIIEGLLESAVVLNSKFNTQEPPPWYRNTTSSVTYSLQLHDDQGREIGWMIPDRLGEQSLSQVMLLKTWESVGACTCCNDEKARFMCFIVLESTSYLYPSYNVFRRIGSGWMHGRHEQRVARQTQSSNDYWTGWKDNMKVRLQII
ncbi:heterokaryon incompatibility protein-domain-containing protein [Dendryphion nanum]|uniref:Heterokaryon incompatibility protein-domain-containing protein n=1 Tax=Dendryphion nanum TaxID=256645 RepID=A0A9P9IRC9_9PLEO|nr:heterokaryon incompatibility protein-domain-containing protein [Dendryphion nanum]